MSNLFLFRTVNPEQNIKCRFFFFFPSGAHSRTDFKVSRRAIPVKKLHDLSCHFIARYLITFTATSLQEERTERVHIVLREFPFICRLIHLSEYAVSKLGQTRVDDPDSQGETYRPRYGICTAFVCLDFTTHPRNYTEACAPPPIKIAKSRKARDDEDTQVPSRNYIGCVSFIAPSRCRRIVAADVAFRAACDNFSFKSLSRNEKASTAAVSLCASIGRSHGRFRLPMTRIVRFLRASPWRAY